MKHRKGPHDLWPQRTTPARESILAFLCIWSLRDHEQPVLALLPREIVRMICEWVRKYQPPVCCYFEPSDDLAHEWAHEILVRFQDIVNPRDHPYLEEVLIKAVLYEEPMKDLSVSINSLHDHYEVGITGYRQPIVHREWCNTFFELTQVEGVCTQWMDNRMIGIIKIKKV